jgi:tetratricopeptide (TPR) repeat protein
VADDAEGSAFGDFAGRIHIEKFRKSKRMIFKPSCSAINLFMHHAGHRIASIVLWLLAYLAAGQIPDYVAENSGNLWHYDDLPVTWNMEGKVQMHLNEGMNLLKESKISGAAGSFSEVISRDPELWVAYYYRGVCYKLLGQFAEAEKDFLTVTRLSKNQPEALFELGKLAQLSSQFDKAEDYFNSAIKSNPEKAAQALMLLGDLELRKGNLNIARKKYFHCLETDPSYVNARVRLGITEILLKQDPKAGLKFFNQALEKDSLHQEALFLRALVNAKDRPRESLIDLNKLVAYNPFNMNYRWNRGLIHTDLSDFENAFADFQKVLQEMSVDERNFKGQQTPLDKLVDIQYAGYYLLSTIYGLPDEAIANVKKAFCLFLIGKFEEGNKTLIQIRGYKNSSLCLFLLGLGHEHSGLHEAAMKYYDAALALDNEIQDAHTKRGIYYTNLSMWGKAESDFSEAIRINPKATQVYKLRGVARYYLGYYNQAITDFNIFLQDKESAEDFLKCGTCTPDFKSFLEILKPILQQGDTTSVLSLLEKFSVNNSSVTVLLYKVNLLIETKRYKEAQALLESNLSFASKQPVDQYSGFLTALGVVCFKQNDLDRAEKLFTLAVEQFNNARAYRERGLVYLAQQKVWQAKNDFKKAADLGDAEAVKLLASMQKK